MATEEKKIDEITIPDDPDDDEEEAIAKRLRDKIRSQAENLLNRVDSVRGDDTATTTDSPRPVMSASDTLAKRLQALAVRRTSTQENAQRLRLIQHEQAKGKHQHLTSAETFQELKLPKFLLDAIYSMGFDRPSEIQAKSLPLILQGRNLMGQAQSGSGKTAAFTIGMLYHIDLSIQSPQAICVTPTRELAIQIVESTIRPMSQFMEGFRCMLAISQAIVENRTVDAHIVVGTPGKVVDWLKRKYINSKHVKVLVLDEADAMVETHRANSLLIRKHMPNTVQSLLFSATFPASTLEFSSKFVKTADRILIDSEDLVLEVIKQVWIDTRATYSKLEFLADIYSILTIAQSIVFVNTKTDADKVYATLTDSGYTCSVIHSGIEDRDTVMKEFREGSSNVLISTNVLARGVDVDAVCLVINYDVPIDKDGRGDAETYLHRYERTLPIRPFLFDSHDQHRIGRTGRFGRKGTAINFCDSDEAVSALADIEKYYKDGQEMIHQVPADPEALAAAIEI